MTWDTNDDCGDSSKNDGWGSSKDDGWGQTSKNDNRQQSSKRDGWGESSKSNDWGQSSKKDGWGQSSNSDNRRQSNKDGWGGSSKSNDWGQSSKGDNRRQSSKNDGWGGSSKDDGWGGSSKDDGGWGGSSKDDGWGQTSKNDNRKQSSKNDGWGGSSKDDGWGGSSKSDNRGQSSKNESWGGSTNNDNWGEQRNNKGGWGDQSGSRKREDRNEDDSRKRFKTDDPDRPEPFKPVEQEGLQFEEVGEYFEKLSEQKVTCFPPDSIKPIKDFKDAITSKHLLDIIKFQRYKSLTPIQQWAIPAILAGQDMIGSAQTGSGKTAAFVLPILQKLLDTELEPNDPNSDCAHPYCLIISPTRELARQIYNHTTALSKDSIIKSCVIYGSISTAHLKSKLTAGCHILAATPGRLKDFVERDWISFKNIKYVVLDEGDRLVDEGFTSAIDWFFNHPSMPPKESRQVFFFSATFKTETQHAAKRYLKNEFVFITVGKVGSANENISQEIIPIQRSEKKKKLKEILLSLKEDEKTMIFTQTKAMADMLASFLTALKLNSTSIHGDRHQSQREQAINEFTKGTRRFLISSPVGNRGLDLPQVAVVINYDMPSNADEYVHRIGRTGRAGYSGRAISFYDETKDSEMLPSLIDILQQAKQEIPSWMDPNSQSELKSGETKADSAVAADSWNDGGGWDDNSKPAAEAKTSDSKQAATSDNNWDNEEW